MTRSPTWSEALRLAAERRRNALLLASVPVIVALSGAIGMAVQALAIGGVM